MLSRRFAVTSFLLFILLAACSSTGIAATITGTLTAAGQTNEHIITLPTPQTGARLVLSSSSNTNFSFHTGTTGATGSIANSNAKTLHTLQVLSTNVNMVAGNSYHVRVTAPLGSTYPLTYTFTDDLTYARDLTWDPGTVPGGSNVISQPDIAGGDYVFKIVTPASSAYGAWRTALAVTGGEASVEIFKTTPPVHTTATPTNVLMKSVNPGSDGFVLAPGTGADQFAAAQTWYIRVRAEVGATWNLYSGDIYVQNLGTVAADLSSSSPSATVGPEGTYYFRTVADATTPAWKLWLDGSSLPIVVAKNSAPVSGVAASYQQSEAGQMLLVPPYLTSADTYFVGVTAAPGTVFGFTSQKQPIIDLAHGATATNSVTGYGYTTYRVEIPPTEIAWQVDLARTSAAGNPELYLRTGAIPNVRNNSALSEAAAGVDDSITIVPVIGIVPTGTWYITVKGTGSFDYSLANKAPVVTTIPYLSAPGFTTNDDPARSGWRYYRVSDPASFLGKLGWQIELDQAHRAGYEIATRLNVMPGRWTSRSNDSATAVPYSTFMYGSSTSGILQHPNHSPDIFYIGIYNPAQALGAFQLTTSEMVPVVTDLAAQGSVTVANQDISTWQYFKFVIPDDPNLKGWDLRLKTTAGNPQMVVARSVLPSTFTISTLYSGSTWPVGAQWPAAVITGGGYDWTLRSRVGAIQDPNNYLIMGMGSPLEPGTYYVGVARQPGSTNSAAMSYTLESRGIGLAGSSYPVQIAELNFSGAGSSVSASGLAPREVGWYRVNVPPGSDSWSLKLEPTVGEAMLAIRQGVLPNTAASLSATNVSELGAGTARRKSGNEYFYKFAGTPATAITSGDYYIAVISEGQNPPNTTTIGSGPVDYTLTSIGTMPVDATVPPSTLTEVAPVNWGPQTLPYGSVKAYRFRMPAGLNGVEIRLNNKVGNPLAAIRQDANDSGKLTFQSTTSGQYQKMEGGYVSSWRNTSTGSIITIGAPVAGDYTITVFADYVNATNSDASYTLEVAAIVPSDFAFDLAATNSVTVTGQDYQIWRYFRVVIPDDSTLKGWDLRLKTAAGSPQMVVRRDQPPITLGTSGGCGSPVAVYNCSTWATGSQWAAGTGASIDWTGRYNVSAAPVTADKNNYLIMGMGSPLVPGTYYIGVASSSGTAAMSYTLESRSIGMGGSHPVQVNDLPFSGGVATATGLAPREVGWYRVSVPVGAVSWSLNLVPEGSGEALLAVRHGQLPNVRAVKTVLSDNATSFAGTVRQKSGQEFFYKYPPTGAATAITSGDYYIAVVSEGQGPTNANTIGSGTVNYTLTSVGTMPIEDKTATPLVIGVPLGWPGQVLPYGSEKVYRFRAPAGLDTIEVRLLNKSGEPVFSVRRDTAGSGRIPNVFNTGNYYGPHEGGDSYTWRNNAISPGVNSVIITPASEGDYTLTVKADYTGSTMPDAAFDLEIVGTSNSVAVPAISISNGTEAVTGQAPATWKYFQIVVPNDPTLKGLDLRLNPTVGNPQMVVRRDQLPTDFTQSSVPGCASIYSCSTWPSGAQWALKYDWTGRTHIGASNTPDYSEQLIVGMGSPLEPGTYYVGVTSATDTLDYTLNVRGIGFGTGSLGSPWPIQITDLPFTGGSVTASGLAPREVGWYRVTVPAEAASWSLNMVPTLGEALLAVRHGRLPNIAATNYPSDHATDFRGVVRHRAGSEFFYKYAPAGQPLITSGEYYVAVISEGQNPPGDSVIGSGTVNYTITSVGTMPVTDTTATPVGVSTPSLWPAQSIPLGQEKIYRFRLPAGLTAVEIGLKNRIGNPIMTIRRDSEGAGKIADLQTIWVGQLHEGGDTATWHSRPDPADKTAGLSTINLFAPVAGDYTVTVVSDIEFVITGYTVLGPEGYMSQVDASFDLEVRALPPVPLPFTPGSSVSGSLGDNQLAYYQFDVPATLNGQPLLGWQLKWTASNGALGIRVRQGQVPGADNSGSLVGSDRTSVIVPPALTPGVWYVELKGIGSTQYTLTTDVITDDPARYARSWTMPPKVGTFSQPGLDAPYFGDSGVADDGTPLPGDQGTLLEQEGWHYYRVIVPDNNSGLLRTELSVLSGRPQIYLRAGALPGMGHFVNPPQPALHPTLMLPPPQGAINAYDYSNAEAYLLGSRSNSWVPLDGRSSTQLTPGVWWIGVRAWAVNSIYRLKVAAGDVQDEAGVRQDTTGYVQDLAQDGGSHVSQTLVMGDMRYYRVTVPESSTTLASSSPLSWSVTLNQTQGDVVMFVRDTLPPGQRDGYVDYYPPELDLFGYTIDQLIAFHTQTASAYFLDWYDDHTINPFNNPYTVIASGGTTTLAMPPVKPGKVYYLGVFARSSAIFDISSSVGPERLPLAGVLPYSNGAASGTLAAGEVRIYRIDVPPNATVWRHTATRDTNVQLNLRQGTVPFQDGYDHWRAYSTAANDLTQNMTGYPWQPGQSYYLLVSNPTAGPLFFSFNMSGLSTDSALIGVSSTTLDFGTVMPPATSVPQQVTISNSGGGNLVVSSITVTGGDAAQFTILPGNGSGGTCGPTPVIPPGGGCTVSVTFTASMSGAKLASLRISSNAAGSPDTYIDLSGSGEVIFLSVTGGVTATGGGSINCPAYAIYGYSSTCTISPALGYHLNGLSDNMADAFLSYVPADSSYTIPSVTKNHLVLASFGTGPSSTPLLRLESTPPTYFSSLPMAYNNVAGTGAAEIKSRDTDFSGDVTFWAAVPVLIDGGYDATFMNQTGFTRIDGSMTISSGPVRVRKLKIFRSPPPP